MRIRQSAKRKPFVVDGQRYEVTVSAVFGDKVHLRTTIRAMFGSRSYCIIRGLQNFAYYHNYGLWDEVNFSEFADSITITPGLIAELIRYARNNGWSPETSKSNENLNISNLEAKALINEQACLDD